MEAQERLDSIDKTIADLPPTDKAIVEGCAAQIELACLNVPRGLALMAITKVSCEVVAQVKTGMAERKGRGLLIVGRA